MSDAMMSRHPDLDQALNEEEVPIEKALRPSALDEFTGQAALKGNLKVN